MRLVLTGSKGRLGSAIEAALRGDGHDVVGFDRLLGQDVRDFDALREALANSPDAVVHLAGLADDRAADPCEVLGVNVIGVFNVLRAAETSGTRRVVYFSSGKALGMVAKAPQYLPVDDAHEYPPFRAYGLSKWLGEEMCRVFTENTGIPTICLRPVAVLTEPEDYARYESAQVQTDGWHLGSFIDMSDVVEATRRSLERPVSGHLRLLLCADSVAGEMTSQEFIDKFHMGAPWRGQKLSEDSRAALVSSARAEEVLQWHPKVQWG